MTDSKQRSMVCIHKNSHLQSTRVRAHVRWRSWEARPRSSGQVLAWEET